MRSATPGIGDERGITVAEILVATAIIGIGLVALMAVIPLSSYALHEGKSLSTATFLAEQKLEEIRNATWASVPVANDCLGAGSPPSSATCTRSQPTRCTGACSPTYANESPVAGYPGYNRSVSIASCAANACFSGVDEPDKMRLVTVTVTYAPMTGAGATTKSAVVGMVVSMRE